MSFEFSFLAILICLNLVFVVHSIEPDAGYENLFVSANATIERNCISISSTSSTSALPAYLQGSFLIPTVAQFEMGGQRLEGVLDGFGKLNRFDVDGARGEVCFQARMMNTGFYQESQTLGKVSQSLFKKCELNHLPAKFP